MLPNSLFNIEEHKWLSRGILKTQDCARHGLGHSRGGPLEDLKRSPLPKVLYGALFVAGLPLALVLWAHGARSAVHLAPLHSIGWGCALLAFGMLAMAAGMVSLWVSGGGLPMNAFPPPRFVAGGVYGLVPHPIYGGFTIACAGAAIYFGSASGLWLVTPSVALASAALVLGYELPDLRNRFGAPAFSPGFPRIGLRLRLFWSACVSISWFFYRGWQSMSCWGLSASPLTR